MLLKRKGECLSSEIVNKHLPVKKLSGEQIMFILRTMTLRWLNTVFNNLTSVCKGMQN